VDPLAHVLQGFRESLLRQAASKLVTPPSDRNVKRLHDDLHADDQYVRFCDRMISRFQTIFSTKIVIFRLSKSANFLKKINIFSSRLPVFFILSVFRQKRNSLESNDF